jgi:hypothetical protein
MSPAEEILFRMLSNECSNPQGGEKEDSPKRVFHFEGHCCHHYIYAEHDGDYDHKLKLQKYKNIMNYTE